MAVRHGETTLNAAGRLTGQLDPPLTEHGRQQARALAPIAAGAFDLRLHSGLQRAEATLALACAAAGRPDAPLVADPRWRERSFGTLDGAPKEAWVQPADVDAAPPGGESYRVLGLRVHAALVDLAGTVPAPGPGRPPRVLLCAHSGVLRMLRGIADGATVLERLLGGPGAVNGQALELRYATLELPAFLAAPIAS